MMGWLKLPLPSKSALVTVVQLLKGKARVVEVRILTGPLGAPLLALTVMDPLERVLKSTLVMAGRGNVPVTLT